MSHYSEDAIVAFAHKDHPLFRPERAGLRIAELSR